MEPKSVSVTALSQQVPLGLIEPRMPKAASCFGKSPLALLVASVRMKDQAGCWPSAEPSHTQCVDDQAPFHALAHGQVDNLTTEQIDDDGEIDPAFLGPEINDVARPDPVWRIDRKLACEPMSKIPCQ